MKKKILYWMLGIIVIGAGIFVYNVYSSVSKTVDTMHEPLKRDKSEKREEEVSTKDEHPISILVFGVDERENDRGRSDSLMLLTVNPAEKSTKMLSIPRDSYTDIIGKGKKDKINHAYAFGGVNMTIDTVENFLNVPIDYYIQVNMEGFKDIVDAVGGVTVNNDFAFTYGGYDFAKGVIDLNGDEALVYSRMRYEDPNGDFGRQHRQRQVLQAVVQRGATVESLTNYGGILEAIQKNVRTNMTVEDMYNIQKNYRDASKHMEELQIPGEGTKMDGIYYYIVSDETKQELSHTLRQHLGLAAE
ncbi:LytR family transcriptional regulator [Bacillus sp. 165]|uniref:polyisoprenyl-teichoic acid--peptidoglycan teichoic acid transferase TagU n=1 Tax=Bacillus sp. 165 TaxID=1529117 RepID=UPI001ADA2126|nr:LytR family transcriptional regulator [Bacillus sp. 165]MBO9130016.1 LytR family transcriptional regulator [Bacillus sp. 165]